MTMSAITPQEVQRLVEAAKARVVQLRSAGEGNEADKVDSWISQTGIEPNEEP